MTRWIAAQLGLLTFACALLAGVWSGNAPTTILARALLAMIAGFAVGALVALIARLLVRDHLQRRKVEIDRQHVAALAAAGPEPEPELDTTEDRG
jgi:hypothetical protein